MATKRMLVDAIHPEETRIVVTSGNRLEEFDFESATRRQLRGNIYLAKVTRVEPSLQAAFVEYGGNRHGFLAFSEIHPDYYQIPVADREALLRDEEAEEQEEHAAADVAEASVSAPVGADADPQSTEPDDGEDDDGHVEQAPASSEPIESVGGGDALEEMPQQPQRRRTQKYKIQEVIKRRQVMLVQVVKEERGNKGAALTTYLSLAGRYSVLMPNTARGGGISRKITNAADRKRLKEITNDLEVPQGMGIILRTAGASRTKAEVKRDFEYLMRLWESVRNLTLQSTAPCLVYEEGSLIKRTIRDLYNKDIDELYVAGENAYREAKDFMRMIMPSHAKNVQLYKDDQPLFSKYTVEPQLDQMFSPQVTLPSGGYIVINPTEALVSIDVNSGRSTREHNIEDTALQTNLEAAEEISRQLRLRDLAGLIVIDFIDMIENRSNRSVERKLKDCLKNDRARIQVGRISHFGLMEMSRQRIRFGVVESSTHKCPLCEGTGLVRSVESVALMVMRHVEDTVLRRPGQSINVRVPVDVALYILNSKRGTLSGLEVKYRLSITISADGKLNGNQFAIEKGEDRAHQFADERPTEHVKVDSAAIEEGDDEEEDVEEAEDEEAVENVGAAPSETADDQSGRGPRRRRRRRGGERGDERDGQRPPQPQRAPQQATVEPAVSEDAGDDDEDEERPAAAGPRADGDEPRKRRRRGRRGGRRNRRGLEEGGAPESQPPREPMTGDAENGMTAVADASTVEADAVHLATQDAIAPEAEPAIAEKPKRVRRAKKDAAPEADAETAAEAVVEAKPKKPRTRKAKPAETADAETPETTAPEPAEAQTPAAAPAAVAVVEEVVQTAPRPQPVGAEPDASRRPKRELPEEGVVVVSSPTAPANDTEADKPKKAGWWQRGFLGG